VVYNLLKYKENISKSELTSFISFFKLPTKQMYDSTGVSLNDIFYNKVKVNCNLPSIRENNNVSYGLVIRKTNLRTFPTDEGVYDSNNLREIDRFQESSAEPCEPVIILHTSSDKKWFFIQMYNYRAWIKVEDVALSKDKKTVIDYFQSKNFLMVTGNHIKSQFNPLDKTMSQIEFSMGTKIPILDNAPENVANQSTSGNYVVMLPCRNDKGKLEIKNVELEIESISIYNLLGEEKYAAAIGSRQKEITINVSSLSCGIYIVQSTSGEKIFRGKVVKQ